MSGPSSIVPVTSSRTKWGSSGPDDPKSATSIHGSIRTKFVALGGVGSLGPPLTDETETPGHLGRYNDFASDTIVFNNGSGAFSAGISINPGNGFAANVVLDRVHPTLITTDEGERRSA